MATAIFMVLLVAVAAVAAEYQHPWEGGKHSNCDLESTTSICGPSAGSHWPRLWIYQPPRGCQNKQVCPSLLSFAFKNYRECRDAHKRCEKLESCLKQQEGRY
uniref:Putative salivary secreted protein variant n=1 Tax=Ornithodoros turicata TaxID=34597 RepID=A0A2R5L5V7_9ACAR